MHPPIFFSSCRKENGPCTVQKKRRRAAKRPIRGLFAEMRESCESVQRLTRVPLTLRRTRFREELRSRITTASGKRGRNLNRRISTLARSALPARNTSYPLRAAPANQVSLPQTSPVRFPQRPAPSEAEGAEREVSQIRLPTWLSAAVVMRLQGFSTARQGAGTTGPSSSAGPIRQTPVLTDRLDACPSQAFFLFHRARRRR